MKSYRYKILLSTLVLTLTAGLVLAGAGCCGTCQAKQEKSSCCGTCKTEPAKGDCSPCAKSAHAEMATIDTHALEKIIAAGVGVTILDARSGKWDDGKRIPGAKALSPSATAKEAAKLIKTKDSLVVTYCTSPKCGASPALAKNLTKLGYKNVIEYPAGIKGWEKHGGKVVKTK